ncbi:MAG: hypothetical protein JNM79_17310 [Burkholderiales bacterium]|nr:hypothetical protein [Burkholderiales bacterium]
MATFRLFRFLRRRLTIAAPRMAVRTHIPWYWRGLFWVVVLSVSLAGATWVYDAGRRFAGFDSGEMRDELAELRQRAARLTDENADLRAQNNASGSRLTIEQATQRDLASQVIALEADNARLKEDIALFEGLMSTERREGTLAINGARVVVEGGLLKFRMLVSRGARTGSIMGGNQEPEFVGRIDFQIDQDNVPGGAMIRLPTAEDTGADAVKVRFRYFQRIEGSLALPAGVAPQKVVVRLIEGERVRASQTVVVSDPAASLPKPAAAPR